VWWSALQCIEERVRRSEQASERNELSATVCCSKLQYVAICCRVLQRGRDKQRRAREIELVLQSVVGCCRVLQGAAWCCGALQCIAVHCSALQCIAVHCSALQCIAVHCSALQCIAVCRGEGERSS